MLILVACIPALLTVAFKIPILFMVVACQASDAAVRHGNYQRLGLTTLELLHYNRESPQAAQQPTGEICTESHSKVLGRSIWFQTGEVLGQMELGRFRRVFWGSEGLHRSWSSFSCPWFRTGGSYRLFYHSHLGSLRQWDWLRSRLSFSTTRWSRTRSLRESHLNG